MSVFKRLLAVLLCLTMICGCAQRTEENDLPESRSVTVETFATLAPESTTTSETIAEPDITTTPTTATDPETTTERSYKTAAPTTSKEETTASSTESYQIIEATGIMEATSSVNVRELPDADSNRVGHLDKGETVTITGRVSNGWVRILYNGAECFVNGSYLKVSDGEVTAVTTASKPETTTTPTTTTAPPTTTTVPTTTPPETTTATATEEPPTADNFEILTSPNSYSALNYAVQKAVWFAYLDIDDMLKNASQSDFTSKISSAFDEVVSLGCNTVYVHVRAFGDAYYYSSLFPFTASYGGILGETPSYDPLEIMISEAHKRGLSFHAWINPMRTTSKTRYAEMGEGYTLKQWYNADSTNGTFMVYDNSTGFWWLSPAYPAVRALICNGVSEIVSRYNVDGIHIDDYFYPTTSSSFDQAAFEASGAKDRAEWRRGIVSSLVKELYNTVKACNQTVEFGVSPQGNIVNNTDNLYADVAAWCAVPGYLDYIVPQIYYGFNDKLSFDTAASQWKDLVTAPNVRLICGIAAYKVGTNTEWSSGEILKKQTDFISDIGGYSGVAYYRHGSLFGTASSSVSLMKTELTTLIRSISEF